MRETSNNQNVEGRMPLDRQRVNRGQEKDRLPTAHCPLPTDLFRARRALEPLIRRTPIEYCRWLSKLVEADVYLKLENLQLTGSFKIRGALNRLLQLTEEERRRGILTVSAGNHGRAVAYGAQLLGLDATVVVPKTAAQTKVEALRQYNVKLLQLGDNYDEAERQARLLEKEGGKTFISPYNDPGVIGGQGTIGLEMLEALPALDTILVAIGGGGLMAGVALAAKMIKPQLRLVGVEPQNSPSMLRSLQTGSIVQIEEDETIADGLAGNIEPGAITFPIIRELVDEIVLVSEEEIGRAVVALLEKDHLVVEGAGAAAVAALISGKVKTSGATVGAVVSGGNISLPLLKTLIMKYSN